MRKTALVPFLLLALAAAGVFVSFRLPFRPVTAPTTVADLDAYLRQFPLQALPYSIDEAMLMPAAPAEGEAFQVRTRQEFDNSLLERQSGWFPSERYSRIPVFDQPLARLETPTHHVVIIERTRGFSGPYSSYVAAVLDRDGALVAATTLAWIAPKRCMTGRIDEALVATFRHFERDDDTRPFAFMSEETVDLKIPAEKPYVPVRPKPAPSQPAGSKAR